MRVHKGSGYEDRRECDGDQQKYNNLIRAQILILQGLKCNGKSIIHLVRTKYCILYYIKKYY